MNVRSNIALKNYLTMRIGGPAKLMAQVSTKDDLVEACALAAEQNLPIFVLGGGSNIVASDEGYDGIIIQNQIKGYDVLEDTPSYATIRIGAGENWDDVVAKTVEAGLSGIEAMSAIPGLAGAAPVQNVGAYGQEIADTLVELDAYDVHSKRFVAMMNAECGFSYRDSIFRNSEKGRYIITSITLKLLRTPPSPPFYAALETYFQKHNVSIYTPKIVRDAVIDIRTEKLPDPTQRPNTGSFFKNAIVEDWKLRELQETWPNIPFYDLGEKKYKIPTGWLIETVGLKGALISGIRIHDKNALVLINESASSYTDLTHARNKIIFAVRDTFRIDILQEPLEI